MVINYYITKIQIAYRQKEIINSEFSNYSCFIMIIELIEVIYIVTFCYILVLTITCKMDNELKRLSTFICWRPAESYPVYPSILASYGFFATGYGDELQCFRCNTRISNWQPNDDPSVRHPPICLHIQQGNESRWQAAVRRENVDVSLTTSQLENNECLTRYINQSSGCVNRMSHSANSHRCLFRCSVCYSGQISVLLLPCSHACYCSLCSDKCRYKCPICRHNVQRKQPIILPTCLELFLELS